jgi:hypothetical protein
MAASSAVGFSVLIIEANDEIFPQYCYNVKKMHSIFVKNNNGQKNKNVIYC